MSALCCLYNYCILFSVMKQYIQIKLTDFNTVADEIVDVERFPAICVTVAYTLNNNILTRNKVEYTIDN